MPRNLPQTTQNQLAVMQEIKTLGIEAEQAILPTTKAKKAREALEKLFDLTQELIIQNGQLMLAVGMAQAPEAQ